MRRHLLVVSEKKIKMLKTAFVAKKKSSILGGVTIIFCAHTVNIKKYLHEIRAHYLQYFSGYTPHRQPQDAGRMTFSPTTLYYKLTGELKIDWGGVER